MFKLLELFRVFACFVLLPLLYHTFCGFSDFFEAHPLTFLSRETNFAIMVEEFFLLAFETVDVALGRFGASVAEHLLHFEQRCALLLNVCAECVAQRVRVEVVIASLFKDFSHSDAQLIVA